MYLALMLKNTKKQSRVELLYCDMRDMRCDNIGSYVLVAA